MRGSASLMGKKRAAQEAVARFVQSGMVLGLGTGSTSDYVLEEIALRLKEGCLKDIKGVPTSFATERLAQKCGIEILTLRECPSLDLAIDGTDQVVLGRLDLIKGHGGALLREKIIAAAAQKFIVVADFSKKAEILGKNCAIPVEVPAFALGAAERALSKAGAVQITLRRTKEGAVFSSDNGNPILDCAFGEILSASKLCEKLDCLPVVLSHGLFCGMASGIFLGHAEKVEFFQPSSGEIPR